MLDFFHMLEIEDPNFLGQRHPPLFINNFDFDPSQDTCKEINKERKPASRKPINGPTGDRIKKKSHTYRHTNIN